MPRTLLALLFALVPGLAFAQPPTTGTTHTFIDPMFGQTVVCDQIDQVRAIAMAPEPGAKFLELFQIPNDRHEPSCASMVPTGVVVDVKPLGRMMRAGKAFHAYAVQSQAAGVTFYALYLEFENIVRA
jgi:hypothetical protein